MTTKKSIKDIDNMISRKWEEILSQPQALNFAESLMAKDRRVYALYMSQVYHYAFHTSRNQALVAVNRRNTDIRYMQFCLEHALEETGHELMALHDLRAIGVPVSGEEDMLPCMSSTELLIAYLYWVSTQGNPVQRLGYSYWAERSYGMIGSFVNGLTSSLGLSKTQMTFFYNHSAIDDKHAKDVEDIIIKVCKTEDDWDSVYKVAETTIDLTFGIISEVLREYEALQKGHSSRFTVLNQLQYVSAQH